MRKKERKEERGAVGRRQKMRECLRTTLHDCEAYWRRVDTGDSDTFTVWGELKDVWSIDVVGDVHNWVTGGVTGHVC
ncbi:hypothetical protein Tco_1492411 [Tanacetum coccineum]